MKKVIIILIVIIVIAGGGFAYFYYFREEPKANTNTTNLNFNQNLNLNLNENLNTNTALTNENVNLTTTTDQDKIKENAVIFAERYGSYSNKNNFENLSNLKSLMSKSLQKETDTYIVQEKSKLTGQEEYFAVATKALSTTISNLTAKKAALTVSTQRTERDVAKETDTYFQNLLLQFIKEDGQWKVDQATWQDRIII